MLNSSLFICWYLYNTMIIRYCQQHFVKFYKNVFKYFYKYKKEAPVGADASSERKDRKCYV